MSDLGDHDHSDHDHDHDHEEHDNEEEVYGSYTESQPQGQGGISVRGWQICSIITIPFIAAVGIFCSIYLSRYQNTIGLCCATMFAAGILLATGLSHMLPESQEILESTSGEFPLSYTLFGACYIFLIFIESAGDQFADRLKRKEAAKDGEEGQEKDAAQDGHDDHHAGHDHGHIHGAPEIANPWAGLLLTIVISFHAILECLALGSCQDKATCRASYIAIAAHKAFASFALGCALIASGYWEKGNRKRFYSCSGTFVGLNLVSIGIGMGLSSKFSENDAAVGVLMALAAGSFLYVGAAEFVPGEMAKMSRLNFNVFPVMFSLMAGYIFMTLLTAYTHPPHDHDHGDHHDHL